jgi:hypothetical protein
MDIGVLIEALPTNIKEHIIDFSEVSIVVSGRRKSALKVLLDKLMTDAEKDSIKSNKRILNVNGIAYYRYAPEIKHSWFYVLR